MNIEVIALFVFILVAYDKIKDYKIKKELEKTKAECMQRSVQHGKI